MSRWVRSHGFEQRLTREGALEHGRRVECRADGRHRDPGATLEGHGLDGMRQINSVGAPVRSERDEPRRPDLVTPSQRLAEREVMGDGKRRPGEGSGRQAGHSRGEPRVLELRGCALPEEGRDEQAEDDVGGGRRPAV